MCRCAFAHLQNPVADPLHGQMITNDKGGHMLIAIGHDNYVMREHILNVLKADGSAIRRLRAEAKERGQLIDATAGGKTRSVIVAVTGQVILSAVQPETVCKRMRTSVQIVS